MHIKELVERQIPWSKATFGTKMRTGGITQHIELELQEIRDNPDDLTEWIDVVLLALDGAWRSGHTPAEIEAALIAKQNKNFKRIWPKHDNPPDEAICHDRTKET